ncbi:unnamed protein product [Aphanomyces euteiches]|nr:hypothetical protein LEN26_019817 [Aphanomyces euteiches]KAH9099279.1 hypothetical protein Ae201684P_018296 [Aphanomyces euteiches]KAH9114641.1 hypothetical protein AeMF1_011298 [Aphanomyces euteiches]KAH9156242.1 hypothetical protein AeRB84_001825 [Aphanomyces euteiches]KAH9191406.1 hypothetical protein AeNC1_006608 [Aphanomyces euteiches]
MSGVHVVEEGNRRKGGMTSEETEQCILDILSWFQRKKAALPKGSMDPQEVEALEKALGVDIPKALAFLLEKQNGGIFFNEYKALSCDDIIATSETSQSWDSWKRGFIPLAADPDGALLVIDTKRGNAVYECSEAAVGRELGASLTAYFENYRNELLSGNFDFVQDVGLVERSTKSRK